MRSAPGVISCRGAAATSSCAADGSRLISTVLIPRIAAVASGTSRMTVSLSVASARPPRRAPNVKPMLSADRMKARDRIRSSPVKMPRV